MNIDNKAVLFSILLLLLLILGKGIVGSTMVEILATANKAADYGSKAFDTEARIETYDTSSSSALVDIHEDEEETEEALEDEEGIEEALEDEEEIKEVLEDEEEIEEALEDDEANLDRTDLETDDVADFDSPIDNKEDSSIGFGPEHTEKNTSPPDTQDRENESKIKKQESEPTVNEPISTDKPELPNKPETGGGTGETGIIMSSQVINSEHIVVYNFDEFKAALASNNTYVNIHLGADITMQAGGIEIHPNKKKVTISGINPLTGTGPYAINETNSLDPAYTIRVVSNTGTKEVTVANVTITGRNFYGAICVYDAVSNVTVTFDNVTYVGPQISYNRNGTLRIIGKSRIRITGENGLSDAHELAEVNALELGGNTIIDHYAPVVSGVWLVGSESYIKVLSDANVIWNETGSYMIFQDDTTPATFTIEEGAQFSIHTLNGLFYNTSTLYHQFGDVQIGLGATLKIEQQEQSESSIPILKVKKSFQVLENASLILIAQNAPQLIYMTGAVDFLAQSPNSLVLYNKTNQLIEWNDMDNHLISLRSTFLNYWSSPCDIAALGGFDDSPLYRWRKKNGKELAVDITTTSATTKSVVSEYDDDDYGFAPTPQTLNMQSARILTAGRLPLKLDIVTEASSHIGGETEPEALLQVIYTNTQGLVQTVYGSANSGGAFDIPLGDMPLVGSDVYVYSSSGYKNVMESTIVVQTSANHLMFVHVPSRMSFPTTSIDIKRKLIPRADENWHMVISDTREFDSTWELYVRLVSSLRAEAIDSTVEDAVVFFDSEGSRTILGDTPVLVAKGSKNDEVETIIRWPADQGILLDLDTLKVYSDSKYTAQMKWILVDGP